MLGPTDMDGVRVTRVRIAQTEDTYRVDLKDLFGRHGPYPRSCQEALYFEHQPLDCRPRHINASARGGAFNTTGDPSATSVPNIDMNWKENDHLIRPPNNGDGWEYSVSLGSPFHPTYGDSSPLGGSSIERPISPLTV